MMDFIEKLHTLSVKIQKQKELIQTGEATKKAFIMPFISALGYDVFDPTEVVPEFIADVGIKKGRKVDYAILRDGKVIMLFECKACNDTLIKVMPPNFTGTSSVTAARIAILTNGIVYRFYTDVEERNKMDSKPFMEFDMLDIRDRLVVELKRFTKQAFNLHEIVTVAGELKYTREIKRILSEQLISPSEDFVRFLAGQVYQGRLTQSMREQFTDIIKRAFPQFINERINDRLRSAMAEAPGTVQATRQLQPTAGETLSESAGAEEC